MTRRRLVALGLLACALSAAAPGARARPVRAGAFVLVRYGVSPAHPWPTDAADDRRSGRGRGRLPRVAPTFQLEMRRDQLGAPIVREDGLVIAPTARGLFAFTPTGAAYENNTLGAAAGVALLPSGDILFAGRAGGVAVVAPAAVGVSPEGGLAASTVVSIPVGIRGAPLVLADGSFVILSIESAARYELDGTRVFEHRLSGAGMGSPARAPDGSIVVATLRGVEWLSLEGAVRGAVELDVDLIAGPAVDARGNAWVVTRDGHVRVLAPTGRELMTYAGLLDTGAGVPFALAGDGSVRVASTFGALVAVGPDGAERWRVEGEGDPTGITVDRDDATVFTTQTGLVVAVDAAGQVLWRLAPPPARRPVLGVDPVIDADGSLWIATQLGVLTHWRAACADAGC